MKTKEDAGLQDIRPLYEALGVERFYTEHGTKYRNPHEGAIRKIIELALERWRPDLSNVLDLACGSGEVTLALCARAVSENPLITGLDPYTADAYLERTGRPAERISFEEIAGGALAGRHYSLIICSFAMHLIDQSWLPSLLLQLGMVSTSMWILTPHKRPEFRREWGWEMKDEIIFDRVRVRKYVSKEESIKY